VKYISTEDPLAVAAVKAIHGGDVEALLKLLFDNLLPGDGAPGSGNKR
jgi:hypothetical protein